MKKRLRLMATFNWLMETVWKNTIIFPLFDLSKQCWPFSEKIFNDLFRGKEEVNCLSLFGSLKFKADMKRFIRCNKIEKCWRIVVQPCQQSSFSFRNHQMYNSKAHEIQGVIRLEYTYSEGIIYTGSVDFFFDHIFKHDHQNDHKFPNIC